MYPITCLSQAVLGKFCQVRGIKVIIFVFKAWQGISSVPERNLGGSWGSVELEVILLSLSSPSSMWGREVRRAEGGGR